jgi:hypothetical protein
MLSLFSLAGSALLRLGSGREESGNFRQEDWRGKTVDQRSSYTSHPILETRLPAQDPTSPRLPPCTKDTPTSLSHDSCFAVKLQYREVVSYYRPLSELEMSHFDCVNVRSDEKAG